MKVSRALSFLKTILLLFSCFSSNISFATEYFLVPGYIKSGSREGGEITFAMNDNFGDSNGTGIVVGAWQGAAQERSIEIQKHSQGHILFSASAGIGAYRTKSSYGVQTTVSLQFWTPFLMFAREQIQNFPVVVAKKPQFGLMFKFPIPFPGSRY